MIRTRSSSLPRQVRRILTGAKRPRPDQLSCTQSSEHPLNCSIHSRESSSTRSPKTGSSAQHLFAGLEAFDGMDPVIFAPTWTPNALPRCLEKHTTVPWIFGPNEDILRIPQSEGREMRNISCRVLGAFTIALKTPTALQRIVYGVALKCLHSVVDIHLTA